ncbi:MAG: glycosyltransferase family 4 protein [Acidobacteria bacterium]|nr:glycosyltransferase family 4 protein [Acidobacteriota bacterium]
MIQFPPRRRSLLVVCHTYPPVLGGSEVEAQRICASLRRRGHDVLVVCSGQPAMPKVIDWVDPYGTRVRIFGRRWPAPWRDFAFAFAVGWTLLWRRYDVVYFLMQGLHLASGLPVARLRRKPILMKFSGSSLISALTRSWLGRLELSFLRRWAASIMILNSGMEQEAAAAGLSRQHLFWMPNPVDVDEFCPLDSDQRQRLRVKLGIASSALVILFVGRLAPEKELPSLLNAFGRVAAHYPDAMLVIVGDGPEGERLAARAGELGLTAHVRFAGRANETGVRKWLQAADLFALVSSNEGFPCSLVEAMATALPSVVSDIPGNTQLITDNVHGLIAEVRNEDALAHAMISLLADADLRVRLGWAARQSVVENYSTDLVVERYERLFAEALSVPEPSVTIENNVR